MLHSRKFFAAALTAFTCTVALPAVADPKEDFTFEVKEYTGHSYRSWVIAKYHTFKIGAKCAAKLPDKKQGALHTASFVTSDIAEYAKGVTGDDWSSIESQSANSPEANRQLVEKMMDEFKSKFSITVSVEGDDCDAANGLWLKYWGQAATSLRNYPPKSGKAFITVNVTSKAKGVTAEVSKDGSTFKFNCSRDVEMPAWTDIMDKAFKRVSKNG